MILFVYSLPYLFFSMYLFSYKFLSIYILFCFIYVNVCMFSSVYIPLYISFIAYVSHRHYPFSFFYPFICDLLCIYLLFYVSLSISLSSVFVHLLVFFLVCFFPFILPRFSLAIYIAFLFMIYTWYMYPILYIYWPLAKNNIGQTNQIKILSKKCLNHFCNMKR